MPVRLVRILSILLLASPSLAYAQPTALSDLHDAARKSREVPEPWVAYGDALLSAERYSKAEDAFIKASRYTKAALPHIRLGDTYMRMKGKTRKAMTKYRKARRRDPSSMEAQMGVARALIQLGNTEAEDEIYRTIALDSTHAAAHLMLAEFYRDTEEPIAMLLAYQDYLKLAPNDVEGHLGLALAYTEQGRYDLVMAITTQMYAIHHDKRYLAYLGQAMAARGDAEEAVRNFRIYILNLMPDQKALYEDLTLVATAEELLTYQASAELTATQVSSGVLASTRPHAHLGRTCAGSRALPSCLVCPDSLLKSRKTMGQARRTLHQIRETGLSLGIVSRQ